MRLRSIRHALSCLATCLFGSLALPTGAWPQASSSPAPETSLNPVNTMKPDMDIHSGWVPVQGPHLSLTGFLGAQAMLESGLIEFQAMAMEELQSLLESGQSDGNDPNLIHLVQQVNLEPFTVVRTNSLPSPFMDPWIRIQGVRLLRLAGGDAAADTLLSILSVDSEPAVLSEAWEAWEFLMPDRGKKPAILMARQLRDPYPNGPNITLMRTIIHSARECQAKLQNMRQAELLESLLALSKDSRYGKTCTREADSLIRFILDLPDIY